jgi:arginyl-tRNA synthetase
VSDTLRQELARIADQLGVPDAAFVLERPRDAGHGDLATNLALILAKPLRASPRILADKILAEMRLPASVVSKTEIAGPGFINFWLAGDQLSALVREVLVEGERYGRAATGAGRRVNVEFVSANPTGPLHVGHGRGAALGDAIASLLEWSGSDVTREFYINDAGVQIDKLAQSLWARVQQAAGREVAVPEGGYHGEYLSETAADLLAEGVAECRRVALATQRQEQDELLADFGVHYDVLVSEQALYDQGRVGHALDVLAERGLTYEQEGALWLRTTAYGDDKDRVLRKSDGSFTYLVPDIAYHIDKRERGFDRVINVWGADHHGYIPRMRSTLAALGYPADFFDVALVQLVKVVKGGEEVKMSKRAGDFVTLRDLIEMVGVDAARYFFLMRRGDSPFIFDVDLATRQTEENPVFYVQMAHARMSGIFRVAGVAPESVGLDVDLTVLPDPEDAELAKALPVFAETVARAGRDLEPHRITSYLEELARICHGWYHKCRVLGEPPEVEKNRLRLARATRTVLANGLALLGLSAPDRM